MGVARVAIAGAACRAPGADSVAALEERLAAGIPLRPRVPPRGGLVRPAGVLDDDPASFDPAPFGLSPREAASLDPTHRLLLALSREALADAGLGPGGTGAVFVAPGPSEYRVVAGKARAIDAWLAAGTLPAGAAGRIARWLDWRGPAIAVDAACASVLVAIDLGVRWLADAGPDAHVVVGGAFRLLDPDGDESLAALGALSPGGRSRPFDADADGYVRAEGGVVLVLGPGPRPRGWILGSAVRHAGAGGSPTAPDAASEADAMRAALAGMRPALVEVHATGTPLGDHEELAALAAVLGPGQAVQASKASVGHLEHAAGGIGVLAALGALRRRRAYPNPGFSRPAAGFTGRWEAPVEGVALVNAFGFGGTAAAVVVEAATELGDRGAPPARVERRIWLAGSAAPIHVADLPAEGPPDPADALARVARGERVAGFVGDALARVAAAERGGSAPAPAVRAVALPPGEPEIRGTTWVVVGGHGALGTRLGAWLAARGAHVVPVGTDAADPAVLARAGAEIARVGRPVGGVVHAAARLADRLLSDLDSESTRSVLHARVGVAQALDRVLPTWRPDRLVVFSSAATWWPAPGQGAYVAANAWLDLWAAGWRARGVRATSIAWGPWGGAGLAEKTAGIRRAEGIAPLDPDEALDAFGRILAADLPYAVVMHPPRADAPLDPRAALAAVFGRADVATDRPLRDQGLDSVGAVELRARLAAAGVNVPVARLLDGASLDDVLQPPPAAAPATSDRFWAGVAVGAGVAAAAAWLLG